jgi:superfamily II DNA or RNA helicase
MDSVTIASLRRTKPHQWQKAAVASLDSILESSDHAYLQAPTGVGKTFAILMHGEQSAIPGYRVIIIGTSQITNQHRKTFTNAGFRQKSDSAFDYVSSKTGQQWLITTWQSIARSPEKFRRRSKCGILYFDECHLGGSSAANVSYGRIVETLKPRKRVMVSATTNVVSEKLLGIRDGHSYVYTLSEAYQDDLLNPVDIVEVQTGLTAEIKRIEAGLGESMENIEELTDTSLAGLAVKLKAKKVAAPDEIAEAARKIIEYRHHAMIDLYLANHKGQSAIFWSPNIDAAKRAAEHFASRTKICGETVHSKLGSEAEDRITLFRNEGIKVVFAVAMLQEGFDMPELALSFDCRFHRQINKNRIARMLQRIGRLTRKAKGKPRSRYYVAPDLTHYYSKYGTIKGSILTASLLAAGDVVSPKDFMASDIVIHDGNTITLSGTKPGDGDEVFIPGKKGSLAKVGDATSGGTYQARATSLYVIESVRDYKRSETVSLSELYGHAVESEKANLIAKAKAGEVKPSYDEDASEASKFYRYMRDDLQFSAAIRDANPDWMVRGSTDAIDNDKAAFVASAKAGEERPNYLSDATRYHRFRNHMHDDPKFLAAILEANPNWSVRDVSEIKAQFIAAAKAGSERPDYSRDTKEYAKFRHHMIKDAHFATAILAANPNWALREGTHSKESLIAAAKAREPRPSAAKDPRGYDRFVTWMKNDSDFAAAIVSANPDWACRNKKYSKGEMIIQAKAGHPRPSETSDRNEYQSFTRWMRTDLVFARAIVEANPNWRSKK